MLNDPAKEAETEPVEVRSYFVRERNALVVRGCFTPIYTDFYLHLMQHGIRYPGEQDEIVRNALAALTLHLASRPHNEAAAWTLTWQDPPRNVFVTGSNRQGNVTGRLFTEHVRERDRNLLLSQVIINGREGRQSMVEVDSLDLFRAGEAFYQQSEQRPGRYFRYSEEDFVLVTAQPDCDLEWLDALDDERIHHLDRDESLSLLEQRHYRFECGCSQDRILPIIANMSGEAVESIFGDEEAIPAGCPRCGARYVVTREALEAFRDG